jgi:N-dimethylarginine dimethylaminohydrolase
MTGRVIVMNGNNSKKSTFGGTGFLWRDRTWSEELHQLWSKGQVTSEWGQLRDVTLVYPSDIYLDLDSKNPDQYLFLEIPKLERLRQQCLSLKEQLEQISVNVHLIQPPSSHPPNLIFQRDLYCSTPKGIILGRPAAVQRRGEEVIQQSELAKRRVPIIMMPIGDSYFEGADLLWIDANNAIVSTNNRTNHHFMKQIQNTVFDDVQFHVLDLPKGVQHTLGIVNFLGKGKIAVWRSQLSNKNLKTLQSISSIQDIIFMEEDDELINQRAMNWVFVRDNSIIMPEGAPRTKRFLEDLGIAVHSVDVSEYIKCGGGMGCATGILCREEESI